MKTYDPKKVILSIGGVQMQGFAEGTFITLERNSDAFTENSGSTGEETRTKSNNKFSTLTTTFVQTSPSNDVLSALAKLDELEGKGVVPVILKEIGGTTNAFSGAGYIKKKAAITYGKEISNREWRLTLSDSEEHVGSIPNQF